MIWRTFSGVHLNRSNAGPDGFGATTREKENE